VNAVYNILSPDIDTSHSRLFAEINLQGISFIVLDEHNTFSSLVSYNFPADTNGKAATNAVQKIFASEKLLADNFKKVDIIYAFAESVLVPYEFMNASVNREMLELVYGDATERVIKSDLMFKRNLYNVYGVPVGIFSLINAKFPSAIHSHLYSILPDILGTEEGNHLYCIFRNNYVTVMLVKNGKLQVVQNFNYLSAVDAVYCLLNVCQGFDIDVNEVQLHLTGMIEKESILYREIYKYFPLILFEGMPENFKYAAAIEKIPHHFFSHLFALTSCV
jgi:hypothetical protein